MKVSNHLRILHMLKKKDTHFGLLFIGGIIGAIVGVIASILLIKSSDKKPRLNSKQGLQLGLKIISLLRSIAKPDN